jgi:polar amino acid transport system substrate-binding protein
VWAAACIVLMLLGTSAEATPYVVDEWRFGIHETNSALSYCVDARDPDWPVARRIAAAIASALLLQPKEYLIGEDIGNEDTSGEDLDNLYRLLIAHCDVAFGFKLVPDAYPQWLTITRPYYRSTYIFVAADPAWGSLSNMPMTRAIGATIGTSADMRLSQYLLALGTAKHWDKYPMSSDEAALRAVLKGTTGAALVWAPAFWAQAKTDAAIGKLPRMAPDPLPVSVADVGAVVLSKQSFIRSSIDQAIASLTADGTIATILTDEHFPGVVVP